MTFRELLARFRAALAPRETNAEESIFKVLCENHQMLGAGGQLLSLDDVLRYTKLAEIEFRKALETRKTTGDVVDQGGRLTLGKSWLKRCKDKIETERQRRGSR